jgi:hypothetical protein
MRTNQYAVGAQRCAASHFEGRCTELLSRKATLPVLLAVCLAFCAACDGGVSVNGHVLDESGRPIKGARVILISKGRMGETMSREDGSYSVGFTHAPGEPNGTLTVSKKGYETYWRQFTSDAEIENKGEIVLKTASSP